MPDDEPAGGGAPARGTMPTNLVHTGATVEEVLAALKSQGISDLESLVKVLVEKAKEQGDPKDDVPDTVDYFIHEHYVLYHDDTHIAEPVVDEPV